MAVYSITYAQRTDNYGVVTLLTTPTLVVGDYIEVAGLQHGLNGTYQIYALPMYLVTGVDQYGQPIVNTSVSLPNQVMFYDAGSTVAREAISPYGTVTEASCVWIDGDMIEDYLGIPTTGAGDAAFLDQCAAAANHFVFRKRQESGYADNPITVPSEDIELGTIMVGAAYFRQRSSYNTIASFDQMGAPPATGVTPMIMQLLGINKAQVA